ncbi:alpha/beta fold hydrolase [Pelobium manganitolerans]|uniref:alpha/beta fold hydrolase n=1 Tax=Pelobium manganitolerans TaxID=1842495 RepID=UPI003FA3B0CD
MTSHFYQHPLVKLHYYKFGNGPKAMLCFHGYGMHGRQFTLLEESLGQQYTFYGFDLFFHKQTVLQNTELEHVKNGISKADLAQLFVDFCREQGIERFSLLSYSMGSFYAATLAEKIPEKIECYITAAPSNLKPGRIITFLSANKIGNKLLERLALSDKAMIRLLELLKKGKIIDKKAHEILFREIATPELRFSFFACATYLRFLKTDLPLFIRQLNKHDIPSIFIFGKRDKSYPASIGKGIIPKIEHAKQVLLDENHDLVKQNFAQTLTNLLS